MRSAVHRRAHDDEAARCPAQARPAHVTVRIADGVGNLRRRDTYLALYAATAVTARRTNFRVVHLSIQRDHLHLIVEADDHAASPAQVESELATFLVEERGEVDASVEQAAAIEATARVLESLRMDAEVRAQRRSSPAVHPILFPEPKQN